MAAKRAKILVVDDEQALAEVMKRVLTRKGYDVRVAYGGHEGLRVVKEFQPHLVLSDVVMAEGTGHELLKSLRAEHPSVPTVFLMTGYTDISEMELKAAGAMRVFRKPVDMNELLALLAEILKQTPEQSSHD